MSVTPIALTRRRALAAGFAGAAAFMTLATRAGSRDSEWAARLDQTIDGAVADRKIGATVVKVVRSGNSRAKLFPARERPEAPAHAKSAWSLNGQEAALAVGDRVQGDALDRPARLEVQYQHLLGAGRCLGFARDASSLLPWLECCPDT